MKIQLVSVPVNNPIEAFNFYTSVLGFVERLFSPEHNLAIVVSPEDQNGTGLLLEPNDNPIASTYQRGVYEAKLPIIVFGVTDVETEYERLKALGVSFTQEPTKTDWGTVEAVFDDTCGNLIQMAQLQG